MAAHIQTACRSSLFLKKSHTRTTERAYKYSLKQALPKTNKHSQAFEFFLIFSAEAYKSPHTNEIRSSQRFQEALISHRENYTTTVGAILNKMCIFLTNFKAGIKSTKMPFP